MTCFRAHVRKDISRDVLRCARTHCTPCTATSLCLCPDPPDARCPECAPAFSALVVRLCSRFLMHTQTSMSKCISLGAQRVGFVSNDQMMRCDGKSSAHTCDGFFFGVLDVVWTPTLVAVPQTCSITELISFHKLTLPKSTKESISNIHTVPAPTQCTIFVTFVARICWCITTTFTAYISGTNMWEGATRFISILKNVWMHCAEYFVFLLHPHLRQLWPSLSWLYFFQAARMVTLIVLCVSTLINNLAKE